MPWTENKRFRLTILGKKFNSNQKTSIEFEVDESHRENFCRTLQYSLASCQTIGATFKFDETYDSETHEITALEVIIQGPFQDLMNVIQDGSRGLKANSVWMK